MIKYIRFFTTILLAFIAFGVKAQSTATSSSPYSRYGLGDINTGLLPQNEAMGDITTAINKINGYNNINPTNPASYSFINLTTIDGGIYSNVLFLSQTGQNSAVNANFRLSHVAFAFPVTHHSAVSFGLLPYSQMGYNFQKTLTRGFGTSSPADTNVTYYNYSGEGGLSKAYIGYGFTIAKHLHLGANVSYIFGTLKQYQTTQFPELYGTLNSTIEQDNSIQGFNYDYGAQYSIDFSERKHLTLGYSGSANTGLTSQTNYIVSQYTIAAGVANAAADSVVGITNAKSKVQLPQINRFGISYQLDGKFLVGADLSLGNWSTLTIDGVNQGFVNSKTLNVGGQFTPNFDAINSYWSTVDYRFGAIYDQSYLNVANPSGIGYSNIKTYALTLGLGLPLHAVYNTFYKINLGLELGQRGTLNNGLVKEDYVNIHLGFLINDLWFIKRKFD